MHKYKCMFLEKTMEETVNVLLQMDRYLGSGGSEYYIQLLLRPSREKSMLHVVPKVNTIHCFF